MAKFAAFIVVAVAAAFLTGCSTAIPTDPEGSLDSVTGGTLRVGVSQSPPWVETPEGEEPRGTEPELLRAFASELDADMEWTEDGEEQLFEALERGELDVVIGGFTDQTPWTKSGAVTRPYTKEQRDGATEKHIMIVRMGENAFLVALETFLLEKVSSR